MTGRQKTQNERVAALLRQAGRHGITQLDADAGLGSGPPIRRLASRINDLRGRGWVIDSSARRNKMALYRLVAEPAAPVRQAEDVPSSSPTNGTAAPVLFEPPAPAARSAILGDNR